MPGEIDYWLSFDRLIGIGLGTKRIASLHQHFGSLKAAWEASTIDLKSVPDMPATVAEQFVAIRDSQSLELGVAKLDQYGIRAFIQTDPLYPSQLKRLAVPPLILYVKGNWDLSWLDKAIAIVGARMASEYAFSQASLLSGQLSSQGFTIISGVATGIDTAAHKGAFQVAGARAIAVVASGVDQVVPQSSRYLYQVLAFAGSIISEYPPETFPEKGFFPARNRIIAALSQSTLVAEAGEGSGSLITARYARELGHPVFCLAGRADHQGNKGSHDWIRRGKAKLITSYVDVLEELGCPIPLRLEFEPSSIADQIPANRQPLHKEGKVEAKKKLPVQAKVFDLEIVTPPIPSLNSVEAQIYAILTEHRLVSLDQLIDLANLPVAKVNSALMTLTLKNLIRREGALIGKA